MKKIVMAVMAIFAYAFIADSAMAASDKTTTGGLTVGASVDPSCRVTSPAGVTFTTPYDPTDTVANDSGQGSFVFKCGKGTAFQLHIVRTGNMTDGTDNLAYMLYSNPGRTIEWATVAAADPLNQSPSSSNTDRTRIVYGRIGAEQNVGVGSYSGTGTITITY